MRSCFSFLSKFCRLEGGVDAREGQGIMANIMSSRSREKIALAVFAALIVLSLCGLGFYLVAGHSWNVAASNIDDTFGSMDGYTTIVYAGTEEQLPKDDAPAPAPDDPLADDSDTTMSDPLAEDDPLSDAPETTTGDPSSSSATPTEHAKPPLSVDAVAESYEEKGATTFTLSTLDPERYKEGVILKKGDHRFGVFSVTRLTSPRVLAQQVAYFNAHKVDFIVALTADKAYVEDVEGLDIVVSVQDEGLFVMGETIGSTFYVSAPELGKVGAILISPSNVVSAKVIEEL